MPVLERQWIDAQPTGYASTGTATTATTNAITWSSWNASESTSWIVSGSSSATDSTWSIWASNTTLTSGSQSIYMSQVAWGDWNTNYVRQAETAAEKAARAARQRLEAVEYERRTAVRTEVRRVAILKADRLLESILTSVQRDQLRKTGSFVVRGQSGQLYRIREGRSANVDVVDAAGRVTERLCAHPILDVPDGDTMAAQKLMLECDEGAFLRMAIKHGAVGQPVPMSMLVC